MPPPEAIEIPLRRPSKEVPKCHAARRNHLKVDSLENREAHASHIQPPPGAEASVKVAKRRASGRSEAESLDGHRSEGYGSMIVSALSISATDLAYSHCLPRVERNR